MDKTEKANLDPVRLHQRQSIKWIYLPMILACLLAFGIGIFFILRSGTNPALTQNWSAISLIFLLLPAAILSIILIAILILAVYGMAKANQALPPRLRSIRQKATSINQKAQSITNKTATPVIKVRTIFSAIEAVFNITLRKK